MNVDQKIKDGAYKTKLEWPKPPDKKCECGKSFVGEAPNFCSGCGNPIKEEYDKKYYDFLLKLNEYRDNEERLIDLFKIDALEECGLTNHPKAEKAFSMACKRHYSNDLQYIFYDLKELAELIL